MKPFISFVVLVLFISCDMNSSRLYFNDYTYSSYEDEQGRAISDYNTIVEFKNAYYRWPLSREELMDHLYRVWPVPKRLEKKAHRGMSWDIINQDTCFVRGGYFNKIRKEGVYVVGDPIMASRMYPMESRCLNQYFSPACFDREGVFLPAESCRFSVENPLTQMINTVLRRYDHPFLEEVNGDWKVAYFVLEYNRGKGLIMETQDRVFGYKQHNDQITRVSRETFSSTSVSCCQAIQAICEDYVKQHSQIETIMLITRLGVGTE